MVILEWHFTALTFASLAILPINGKYTCIPYLQALRCRTVVSKTAVNLRVNAGAMSRNLYLSWQLHQIKV